jgi:hypothetical protein
MATFQVSPTVTKILKNFSGIADSILLVEGKTQRTIAPGKSVLAIAEFPEAWPHETGIYNLSTFLGTLSFYKSPGIEFGEDRMTISENRSRTAYRYSDPSTIFTPPNKTLPTADPAVKFTLSAADLNLLTQVASTLKLNTITVSVNNGDVTLLTADAKNPAGHTQQIDVDPSAITVNTPGFSATLAFKTEHIAMLLDGAYTVSVSKWPYGYFQHTTEPVSYFIVAQA